MNSTKLILDNWLTKQLGLAAYVLKEPLSCFTASDIPSSRSFITAKVESGQQSELSHLQKLDFRVITVNVQLLCKSLPGPGSVDLTNARLASPADEAAIREIARESFIHDRFHADSNIPRSIADAVKEQWVANYFQGKRGDALFVLEERGSILGFLLAIKEKPKSFNIDLIGVAKAHRGKRFGEVLITFAQAYFSAGAHSSEILVGTQISNLSSLRLYQRMGFSVIGSSYMLHYNLNWPAKLRL